MTNAHSLPSELPGGPLSPKSLVRVLRALYVGHQTGLLSLSRGRERLGLRFVAGRIVSGSDGPVGRLGDILVRLGRLSAADLDRALERAALEGLRLGPVLVEEGLTTRERVQEALRLQVRDVLFAAFFWGFGAYRFEADEGPAPQEDVNLEMSTSSLIFEVVSCLESPGTVLASLADVDRPIAAVPDAAARLSRDRANLNPSDGYVLSRADGVMALRQIVDSAALPAQAVERSLVALLCCDAVRPVPPAAPSARPLPSPDQTIAVPRASLRLDAGLGDETVAAPCARLGLAELDEFAGERRDAARTLQAMQEQSHFAVLGVPDGASVDEVKRAFLRLAKRYHPDTTRDAGLAVLKKAIFLRVSEACNILASGDSRARYERRVIGGPARPAQLPPPTPAPDPRPSREVGPLPEPADAVRRAERLVTGGEAFEAATLLADILPHTQGRLRERARLLRARAYLTTPSGSHLAEKEIHELLDDDPACVDACLLLAEIYHANGMTRRAQSQYRRVLALQPDNATASTELEALAFGEPVARRKAVSAPR